MKPPDRPAPGRTDRILGVMGGMLSACALPGQEGPPRRSPLGLGGTEPESERTEGDHRRDREHEVLAGALQPGQGPIHRVLLHRRGQGETWADPADRLNPDPSAPQTPG
ncbi:rho guanine nucleotide exchange factor 25-like [Nomascus leucogenys]|uniref:rho guanine nucleotide exchange factor 25-like n=1 Tax=Nomascus leucogenys TaxID=61853 RepID=UPI00122DA340|nr:rho guanine nucleotide exchange factor 25-like [Nomascus leucogenys]